VKLNVDQMSLKTWSLKTFIFKQQEVNKLKLYLVRFHLELFGWGFFGIVVVVVEIAVNEISH
jgi:hypothetical protein